MRGRMCGETVLEYLKYKRASSGYDLSPANLQECMKGVLYSTFNKIRVKLSLSRP